MDELRAQGCYVLKVRLLGRRRNPHDLEAGREGFVACGTSMLAC